MVRVEPDDDGPLTETVFPVAERVSMVLRYPRDYQLSDRHVRTLLRCGDQLAGVLATVYAKEQDYGEAWREQGWRGNVARILSKTSRLRNMLWRTHTLENHDEPVQDTLQDLIALTLFALINRQGRNEWGRGDEAGL